MFKTDSPYSNNQLITSEISCDNTFTVAYMFQQFKTEETYDFILLTDPVNYEILVRKSLRQRMNTLISIDKVHLALNKLVLFFASGSTLAFHL